MKTLMTNEKETKIKQKINENYRNI